MKYLVIGLLFLMCACAKEPKNVTEHNFTKVDIEILHQDSTSIRAIAVTQDKVVYAGSNGHYGYYELEKSLDTETNSNLIKSQFKNTNKGRVDFLGKYPSFRAIAVTKDAFFLLSIESPALLYRYDKQLNTMQLVYTEDGEGVFYDAITFWNSQEGIAMGDPVGNCLSIIITRNGGTTWEKLDCSNLPAVSEGEAAFAASDTNIKVLGSRTWIISGGMKSRVFYSPDKGKNWSVYDTPIIQGTATSGAYTMDFYDANRGIIYGGDYTHPENNTQNIAVTNDGGQHWKLTSPGKNDGYKSCVQYVPGSRGNALIALGFTGISYSNDGGDSWKTISEEPFLSFRFLNDSVAFAGGKYKLAKLTFK